MFPDKLDPETWDLLVRAGLASDGRGGFYGLQRDFGLIVMGLMAEICAGGTRVKVTNYRDAQEAYTRLIATQQGGTREFQAKTDTAYPALVSISCKSVNVRQLSLRKLVDLRRREDKDGFLPVLRRNYRAALEKCVKRLETEAKSLSDVRQIESEFERDIRDDLHHLGKMLELVGGIQVLTTAFAVLAAIANPSAGLIAAVGATAVGIPSFQLARQKTLEKHFSSWLVDPSHTVRASSV
jgi:hypothetical protein